jgi:hypothetical protein
MAATCAGANPSNVMLTVDIESGTVALPGPLSPDLLAIAVLEPMNNDQTSLMSHRLWVEFVPRDGRRDQLWLPIHRRSGRREDFLRISDQFPSLQVTLEFPPDSRS